MAFSNRSDKPFRKGFLVLSSFPWSMFDLSGHSFTLKESTSGRVNCTS